MCAHFRKELTSSKLKRNIWLLKGVDDDNIIFSVRRCKKGSSVLNVYIEIRLIHGKIRLSNTDNGRINFCAIDWYRSVHLRKLLRNCTARQTNNADTMELLRLKALIEIRCSQEIIPIPAC